MLAYSTISHLGLITLLLGMNSKLALVAAVFHMMNHATFKASLFMAAGIIDHETGTRDIKKLGGLAHVMPITATVATVAAAAMAGVPLLNGFLSKEMFFAEAIVAGESSGMRFTLPLVATLAGVFSVAYSVRFIHRVFFGPLSSRPSLARRRSPLAACCCRAHCWCLRVFSSESCPRRPLAPCWASPRRSILGPQPSVL